MSPARLLPALAFLACVPAAWAQEDLTSSDLVATVFGGFADGASVGMSPDTLTVQRTGPGAYAAKSASLIATLTIVESSPCIFDVTSSIDGKPFLIRIDMGQIDSISFEPGGSMGLPDGILPWQVSITGEDGKAVAVNEDGTTRELGGSPALATSIAVADLDAAAAQLKQACPST